MTNAISKFKFKDLCLLAIFRLSTGDKTQVLIKVGKTSAVEFTSSGELGTDTLTYVYPTDEKKVRLAKDTPVYALNTRLLLSLDFHIKDGLVDEAPPASGKRARNASKSKAPKPKDPGVTLKECEASELQTETGRFEGFPTVSSKVTEQMKASVGAIFHPHPQQGTQDAGMNNPAARVKVSKKPIKKVVKGKK
jgi:hypothetical protein